MAASMPNIHNQLFANGFVLKFEGLRRLVPRQRYIGVQYPAEIREKLKFAKGESGYGTGLAMEKKLDPVAVTQLYPTVSNIGIDEPSWFIALAVPRRKTVYGYEKPILNGESAREMTDLRKSRFHGPDTDGALFYVRESPLYFTRNPHCQQYWSTGKGSWGFMSEPVMPKQRFPRIADFIGDVFSDGTFAPYPPPETKPKTVNEWERYAPSISESDRAYADLRNRCRYVMDVADIRVAWTQACIEFGVRDLAADKVTYQARIDNAAKRLADQYMRQPAPPQPIYTTNWYQNPQMFGVTFTMAAGQSQFYSNAAPPPKKPITSPEPQIDLRGSPRLIVFDDEEEAK